MTFRVRLALFYAVLVFTGTRYKRRGVDGEGHVANYVETELVLQCGSHVVSYVIVRGSVPVYWSQAGNNYRPLPVIEKCEVLVVSRGERVSCSVCVFSFGGDAGSF